MNLFYQKDHDFFNPRGLCRLIFFEAEMRFAQLHLKRSQKYPPDNSHERNAWFFVKKRSTIIFGLKCCCSLLFSRTGSRILRHRKPHNFVSSTFERILAVQRSSFHVHHQNPCSSIIFSNNQFLVLVVIVIVGNFIVAKVQNLTAKLPRTLFGRPSWCLHEIAVEFFSTAHGRLFRKSRKNCHRSLAESKLRKKIAQWETSPSWENSAAEKWGNQEKHPNRVVNLLNQLHTTNSLTYLKRMRPFKNKNVKQLKC